MKYFRGSSGRALRGQPAWPGVSRRQRLGSLTTIVEVGSGSWRPPPLHERERRRGRRRAARTPPRPPRRSAPSCARIAEQVADHAHAARLGQLDQHHDVGPVVLERGMHRMPGALPAIDAAARRHLHPLEIEGETAMADPLRAPLPVAGSRGSAGPAARRARVPSQYGRSSPSRLGHRARQARAAGTRRRSQRRPRAEHMLETGVTIGPEITSATRAPGTWLVDSPRSWRTASICSSSPCM